MICLSVGWVPMAVMILASCAFHTSYEYPAAFQSASHEPPSS
jgi:hypothetical protein